jgi:hypothetical protein
VSRRTETRFGELPTVNATIKSAIATILRIAAAPIGVVGGLLFWFGGGLLHAIDNIDLVAAEGVGIFLALILIGLSVAARTLADNLELPDTGESISLTDALRVASQQPSTQTQRLDPEVDERK